MLNEKKGDEYIIDVNRYICRDKCIYYNKLFIKLIFDDFVSCWIVMNIIVFIKKKCWLVNCFFKFKNLG